MILKTNVFECPTGLINIVSLYNEEEKTLSFDFADGYYYPSDSNSNIKGILAQKFMKEHEKKDCTLREANDYLKELKIEERFSLMAVHIIDYYGVHDRFQIVETGNTPNGFGQKVAVVFINSKGEKERSIVNPNHIQLR